MKRMSFAVLLVVLLASFPFMTAAQETLSAGTVEGTLENATATYQLTAEEGETFLIFLSSPDFDTYVEVLDDSGDSIDWDDDSGTGSNSVLLFIAPESGTYDVRVRSYSGDATGSYSLTLVDQIQDVTLGSEIELDVDGATPVVFRYEAAGDPVDMIVDSGGSVDTSLTVIDALGEMVDSSDDAINSDPAFMPIFLDAGVYYLIVVPYSESAVGAATLSVKETESQALGAEPTIYEFGVDANEDLATAAVEEGKLYRFEVTTSVLSDFNLSLSAIEPDLYTYGYFSFTNGFGGTYLYRADITGVLQVQLSAGYMAVDDELIEYAITFTEVEEE
jgi:hypothetical protein